MSPYRSIIYFCLLFPLTTLAQKVEFGAGLGPTFYKGDLHPRFNVYNPGVAGDVMLRYNFNRVLSARANVMGGLYKGDDKLSTDPFQRERDFSFRNMVLDYTAQVEYNFLNFRTGDGRYEHSWTPHLFVGVGQSRILQKKLIVGNASSTRAGKGGADNILVYGIGFKKAISSRWNISGEFSTRVYLNKKNGSMFDGLAWFGDDMQNSYDNDGLIPHAPVFDYRLMYNGNTRQADKYFHASITLSYLIYRVNCDTPGKRFSFF